MTLEGGSNEDDLTIKLGEIVYTNFIIKDALEKGATVQMLMEDWDFYNFNVPCTLIPNFLVSHLPFKVRNRFEACVSV